MRALARLALWLGALGVPFTIACAYGMPVEYTKSGKVVDADTHEGIEGIQVTCLGGGVERGSALSGADGSVAIETATEDECDTYEAEDVDGAANGSYQPASLPGGAGTFTILMKKAQ